MQAWLVLAAIILITYFSGVQTCPSKIILGIPCPGCGMTRALMQLLQFHLREAFVFHPFVFILVPYGLAFLFFRYFSKNQHTKFFDRLLIVISVAMIIHYAVRMYLYFPHTKPMLYYENNLLHPYLKFFNALTKNYFL